MINFILLSTQRSGSHLLGSLLRSHPEIQLFDESHFNEWNWCDSQRPAHHFYHFWLDRIARNQALIAQRYQVAIAYDYVLQTAGAQTDKNAVGWDIKYDFWEQYPYIKPVFTSLRPKCIHLRRINTLRQYLSEFLMRCDDLKIERGTVESNGRFSLLHRVGPKRVRISTRRSLLRCLKRYENRTSIFSQIAHDHFETLEITYESLLDHQDKQIRMLNPTLSEQFCAFLGVQRKDIHFYTEMEKVSPPDLRQMIDNYSEVRMFLNDTGHEHYLI